MKIWQEFEVSERQIDGEGKALPPHESVEAERFASANRKLSPAMRYEIVLLDANGRVRQHSMGVDRAGAIQGLRAHGFQVEE